MSAEYSFLERNYFSLAKAAKNNALSFLSSMLFGLLAYMFCFANKFEIMDDLSCMFSTGLSVSSGRWGLEIIRHILPAASLPWFNGILSLLLISVSVCLIIRMFQISRPLVQILLSALIVTFPSQTCTFAYMFVSAMYAVSLFMSVLAVYILSKGLNRKNIIAAEFLLVLALGIYQAYIAVSASLLIVFCLKMTLTAENNAGSILKKGGEYILVLVGAMAIYYIVNAVVMKLTGTEYNSYADSNLNSIKDVLFGIRVAYTSFVGYFIKGYYDLVSNRTSMIAHFIMLLLSAVMFIRHFLSGRIKDKKIWVALLCIFLLPLSVNCLRVISAQFHNLMLFSFTSVYVAVAVIIEFCSKDLKGKFSANSRDLISICFAVITFINITFANRVYLKMYMQFEQAKSFYTAAISRIMDEPEFAPGSQIAFVGSGEAIYDIQNINTDNLAGIQLGIIGTYSQNDFIRYFLGLDLNVAGWDVTDVLALDERVIQMPPFPYYGSIQNVDGVFVVKTG